MSCSAILGSHNDISETFATLVTIQKLFSFFILVGTFYYNFLSMYFPLHSKILHNHH